MALTNYNQAIERMTDDELAAEAARLNRSIASDNISEEYTALFQTRKATVESEQEKRKTNGSR